jgi:hypothetical protein
MKPATVIKDRPAEAGALGASVAVLIAYLFGLDDPAVIASLTMVVGALPGVITWIVVTIRNKEGVSTT